MSIDPFMRKVSAFVVRRAPIIFAAALILAALSFPRAKGLFSRIDTDLTRLLPEHYESVKVINEIRKKFKATKSLDIAVENEDPDKAQAYAIDLAAFLEADPVVSQAIIKKPGYAFFDKHKLLYIDLPDLETIRDRIDRRIQREKLGGLYIDFEDEGGAADEEFSFADLDEKYKKQYSSGTRSEYFTNDAGTIYMLYVRPEDEGSGIQGSRAFSDRIHADVERFAAARGDPSTKLHFSGSVRTHVDEYTTLIHDLSKAGIISGIGIFLVLLLYFRRLLAAVLIFAPLAMGILMSFAFASLFIESLNLVTSFLFAILGGLGVEVGIHMLARYIEERRASGAAPRDRHVMEGAIFTVLAHTGMSAFTSAATVAATFFVLILNDFKGFSEFGFIAGFGLVINYLIYMLVFPSVLVLAERARLLGFRRGIGFDGIRRRAAPAPVAPLPPRRFPVPRFVLASFAALTLISVYDLLHVPFEWRFSKIKANLPEAQVARMKQRETSSSVNSPAAIIVRNREEAEAVKEAVNESKARWGERSVIDAYRSSYDLVPPDQERKMAVVGEIRQRLADKTLRLVKGEHKKDLDRFREALDETTPVEEGEIPQRVLEIFKGNIAGTGSELAFINPLPRMELDDGRNAIRFAEQIQNLQTPLGTFHPSSDSIVFADVLQTMIRDGRRVVLFAFVIVLAIVWLDFRRIQTAALVVSPIVLGVLFTFAIMYCLGIHLNFYNIVVIPTSVGTSIDNSIHLLHRYRELGKGSVVAALESSGGAALTSSLTNIFGFLGLCFTFHSGLRSIGTLAVAGLAACLLTTLVYFPAVLQAWEDYKRR